jgi:thiamine biosynthesis lipoprotein
MTTTMTTRWNAVPAKYAGAQMSTVEQHGRAMGTTFHIVLTGASEALLEQMRMRLVALEARWSRFIETSEVSALNKNPDRWHLVSPETVLLVERALCGWARTDGAFDPTVLDAVEAMGYRKSFEKLSDGVSVDATKASLGCAGIDIDRETGLIKLGTGVRFDPGGIGKGLAADLLVEEAMDSGATGAMVNLGGDLACRGVGPNHDPWVVEVAESTVSVGQVPLITLESGAVATSTTQKRRWSTNAGERHHLIDPKTGENTVGVAMATVVAAEGWWAEVVAKQLLVGGCHAPIDLKCAAALIVDDNGVRHGVGEIGRFLP